MGTKGKKKSSSSKTRLEELETVKEDLGLEMEVLADDTTILEEEPDPSASASTSASPTPRKKKKNRSSSKAKLVEKEVVKESLALEMESIETIRELEFAEEELSPGGKKNRGKGSKRSPSGQLRNDRGSSRDSSSSVKKATSLGVSQGSKAKKSPRGHHSDREREREKESGREREKEKEKERGKEKEKESEREKEKDRKKEKEKARAKEKAKERGREKEKEEKKASSKDHSRSTREAREARDREAAEKEERFRAKFRASKDVKDPKKSPKPRRSEERGVVSAPVIVDRLASEPLSVRESMEHMQALKNKVADVRGQLQSERDRAQELYGEEKELSWQELVTTHIRLRVKIKRLEQELKTLRHSKTSKTHG